MIPRHATGFCVAVLALNAAAQPEPLASSDAAANTSHSASTVAWPAVTAQMRPWTYWWWMASAVDRTNLTRELQRYSQAGLGGVHIIPIYGAKGYEDRFIDYLTPKWMDMLSYTITEAHRLGLDVDMTTGSGWCFGGPQVTAHEANALVVVKTFEVKPGEHLPEKFDPRMTQALVAFSPEDACEEVTAHLAADGSLDWSPPSGTWRLFAVSQKPSGQKVKRAGPGGQGPMLNLIYPAAMRHYLDWFEAAFADYRGPKPRAMYHDSYEYRSDWAPDFLAEFEKRRGYRLQTEFPALFDRTQSDRAARVKSDYRETISDVMSEESLPQWAEWSRQHGFLTRNEAHGSPGNWLDLYAAADIPETEMFNQDRNKLVSKFASSAAHVSGKRLVSAETGTWLGEHFHGTLADMKYLLDDMFLSGVNHVFYHGTCYSPDDAGWPGWCFYASFDMNPRNSIWRDVSALNTYATRCQSVLQAGGPDNDVLVYWPIYDVWHNPAGLAQPLTVHARGWFEEQPIGKTAAELWSRGYAFDYLSDRQLGRARVDQGQVALAGARYRVLVVPPTGHLPLETLRRLTQLANDGATILFQAQLPADVPGWGALQERRAEFKRLLSPIHPAGASVVGRGRVLVADLEPGLSGAGVKREPMFDFPGLMCVRRKVADGRDYFIANRSDTNAVRRWVALAHRARSVIRLDPLTGQGGQAAMRPGTSGGSEVFLRLDPGESVILRCSDKPDGQAPDGNYWEPAGSPQTLGTEWKLSFIAGGPELPPPLKLQHLVSWTELVDTNAQRFAGTGRYETVFDGPAGKSDHWQLDLGTVCQSARVRLNDQDLGTRITPPFRTLIGSLRAKGNRLEIEVTNVSANRVRDMDQRGMKWKNFYDINMVGLDYRPLDATAWSPVPSGLLGPVTLTPVAQLRTEP